MCRISLEKLNLLVMHPDARVLKVASDAIIFLLKYQIGQDIAGIAGNPNLQCGTDLFLFCSR